MWMCICIDNIYLLCFPITLYNMCVFLQHNEMVKHWEIERYKYVYYISYCNTVLFTYITKKLFNADLVLHNSSKNWSSEIKQVMNDIGLSDQFESKSVINLSKVDEHLNVFYARKWQEDVQHVPKLRTYRVFNRGVCQTQYV